MNDISIQTALPLSQNLKGEKIADRNIANEQQSFGQWLNKSIENVNKLQQEGDASAAKLLTGQNTDIHGTMIAMQKATISMNLMLEVRNKIISAYDEIKRMQF